MNDEQAINYSADNSQAVSSREQRLIEQIKKHLLHTYSLLPETIEQLFHSLPEKYKTMAIHTLAEQFVSGMKIHMLHAIATFYQQAIEEGIEQEERDETLEDVEANIYDLMALSRRLVIDTPGDLFKLGKITTSVQGLSQFDTAEEAQRWLYNLPVIYQGRLEREHLTEKEFSAIIPFPVNSVTIQVKLIHHPTTTDAGSRTEYNTQRSSSEQLTQTDESRQWGKVLSFHQQPDTAGIQTKGYPIEVKQRLSS